MDKRLISKMNNLEAMSQFLESKVEIQVGRFLGHVKVVIDLGDGTKVKTTRNELARQLIKLSEGRNDTSSMKAFNQIKDRITRYDKKSRSRLADTQITLRKIAKLFDAFINRGRDKKIAQAFDRLQQAHYSARGSLDLKEYKTDIIEGNSNKNYNLLSVNHETTRKISSSNRAIDAGFLEELKPGETLSQEKTLKCGNKSINCAAVCHYSGRNNNLKIKNQYLDRVEYESISFKLGGKIINTTFVLSCDCFNSPRKAEIYTNTDSNLFSGKEKSLAIKRS